MTKKWRATNTVNLKIPLCTSQVACDGAVLVPARRERGVCSKCDEAVKKRGIVIPPKGINSALPESIRKGTKS